ncbi:formin-like protein 18 [Miscanthus floridulus]|uniref:formin-like protein 18 n=1 Tax=Miscanthus floridulus TaxID=154761 RepID=UPI00345AF453
MVSILKMHRSFSTFAEARTHLLLEEMEIDAQPPSPPSALIAATPRPAVPEAPAPPCPGTFPPARPPGAPTGGHRNGRRRGRGGPSAPPSGVPPGVHGGMHPSFAHPWAGTIQMWPYDRSGRPPPAPPAFTAVPQYGGFGGAYGGTYGPPPPQ